LKWREPAVRPPKGLPPVDNEFVSRCIFLLIGFLLGGPVGIVGYKIWEPRHSSRLDELPSRFADAHLSRLPFDGQWFVMSGGDQAWQNRHHGRLNQNLALDLLKVAGPAARTYEGDAQRNESYFCWGQPIRSPIEGKVEITLDGIPDNIPGEGNSYSASGNSVQIRDAKGFVIEFAHLRCGTVAVRAGSKVRPGDLIGYCGNSGNSTEPHLHFQIQSESGQDQGIALRPIFDAIIVDGKQLKDHSPVKSERISNPIQGPDE
jgi:hypothetical protein